MQSADLILLNGASYESWLGNVSLPSSKLIDTSDSFRERLIVLEDAGTHSHGPEGEHEHSGTAFTTWLDLTLAVEQARAIQGAFAARWPEHEGQFETQFDRLAQELDALDGEIKEIVAGNPGLPVLFSHPVYQYFQARYGTNGRSVHWEPDQMPEEAMWQELADLTSDHPAKWMIWEGEPLPEISTRLKAAGIESVVFDPCGNTPQEGEFLSAMRRNVEALRTVFGK